MSTRTNNIPGITEIYVVPQEKLTKDVAMYALSGTPVIIPVSRERIPFFGIPQLYSKSNTELNGKVSEAKLKFRSNVDIIPFGYVFAVKAAAGKGYLIGTDKTQPALDRSDSTGSPNGEPAVYEYEITMKDVITPIDCIL